MNNSEKTCLECVHFCGQTNCGICRKKRIVRWVHAKACGAFETKEVKK